MMDELMNSLETASQLYNDMCKLLCDVNVCNCAVEMPQSEAALHPSPACVRMDSVGMLF